MQVLTLSLLHFVNFADDMTHEVTDIALGIANQLLKQFYPLNFVD
jgi:hypothetical protein